MSHTASLEASYAERWIAEFFASRAATSGGVIRRSRKEVDLRIGVDRLELEVRRRGFHLLSCGTQYIVVCDCAPVLARC